MGFRVGGDLWVRWVCSVRTGGGGNQDSGPFSAIESHLGSSGHPPHRLGLRYIAVKATRSS